MIIEDEDLDTMLPDDYLDMWYQGRCGRRTNFIPQREMDMFGKMDDLLTVVQELEVKSLNHMLITGLEVYLGFESDEPLKKLLKAILALRKV
jgi:hypothetical protein